MVAALMLSLMFLILGAKKDAWFTIYYSMRLYAVLLILNYVDYANCITSTSSSFNSSIDNDGT